MPIDALIFDYDGTLVDTNPLHAEAWRRALHDFGMGVGEDRLLRLIGMSGRYFVPHLLGERIEKEHGDALRDAHDEHYLELVAQKEVRTFSCAERLLHLARERGFKTALSTGSAREAVERVAEATRLDVLNLVDAVVTASDQTGGKPGPEPVRAAADHLGLAPSQCVLIGDTPYDVESAFSAGAVTIGVGAAAYSADELLNAGARTAYPSVEALGQDLDEAVKRCTPGRVSLTPSFLDSLMGEALAEARKALESDNLPVGAVLVDGDGHIVSRGFSRTETSGDFLDHAEMIAFREAVGKVSLSRRELILFTTLEPCMMCYGASMGARVETIVFALEAPSNGGIRRCDPMRSPGMIPPRVVGGVGSDESIQLFREWDAKHPGTPFVADLLGRV